MNVYQWCGLDNPHFLLSSLLDSPVSQRKLQLFLVACCRRVSQHLEDEKSRQALEVAEQWADGQATLADLQAASGDHPWLRHASNLDQPDDREQSASWNAAKAVYYCTTFQADKNWGTVLDNAAIAASRTPENMSRADARFIERDRQCDLLRCVFGNPFWPVRFNSACRSANVLAVAEAIYEESRFADMPILGDALEETGCTADNILSHCRTGGVHARGCWLVDLILGKE